MAMGLWFNVGKVILKGTKHMQHILILYIHVHAIEEFIFSCPVFVSVNEGDFFLHSSSTNHLELTQE